MKRCRLNKTQKAFINSPGTPMPLQRLAFSLPTKAKCFHFLALPSHRHLCNPPASSATPLTPPYLLTPQRQLNALKGPLSPRQVPYLYLEPSRWHHYSPCSSHKPRVGSFDFTKMVISKLKSKWEISDKVLYVPLNWRSWWSTPINNMFKTSPKSMHLFAFVKSLWATVRMSLWHSFETTKLEEQIHENHKSYPTLRSRYCPSK